MQQTLNITDNVLTNFNKNSKQTKNSKTDINFLELLLKNTKIETKSNNKEIKSDNHTIKELQELLKELLLNINTPQKNNKINNILNQLNKDKNIVKEIKNIIQSNIKQQNILLNKMELKNFKKIDNIKDLFTFANKKGLNIEKLTFDIAKNIIQKPQLQNSILKDMQHNIQHIIDTHSFKSKIFKSQNLTTQIFMKNNLHSNLLKHNSLQKQPNQISLKSFINLSNSNKSNNNQIFHNISKTNKPKTENKIENINNISHNNLSKTKHKENHISLDNLIKNTDLNHKNNIKQSNIEEISQNITNIQNQNIQNNNEIKAKQVLAKETINYFKNNLDEAIKNYKPPISKVNIELNPKNLGKVEVTIIQRGNNIQVNLHTDQNNVALFQTHQAEFRQALSNIGFSNIDMNFNSNQDKEKKQNQAKKIYKQNKEETSEIEIKATYKYA